MRLETGKKGGKTIMVAEGLQEEKVREEIRDIYKRQRKREREREEGGGGRWGELKFKSLKP